jgi:hypothetical protein
MAADGPAAAVPGPFRVMRITQLPGQAKGGAPQTLAGPCATRDAARSAAVSDAGQPLSWKPGDRAGMESAVYLRDDGARVGYAVSCPPRAAG